MDTKQIMNLIDEDPQKLVDLGVEFELRRYRVGIGRAKLVDGVAAGSAFLIFEFTDGKYAGKRIACEVNYRDGKTSSFFYSTNVNSDGFLFNWDPSVDVSNVGDGFATGGDCIPELNGTAMTIK